MKISSNSPEFNTNVASDAELIIYLKDQYAQQQGIIARLTQVNATQATELKALQDKVMAARTLVNEYQNIIDDQKNNIQSLKTSLDEKMTNIRSLMEELQE
jgi:chromosome segregation ATPase